MQYAKITDHSSLTYLLNKKKTTSRLARWKVVLSDYNYEIEHIKGKLNPADVLSRREYAEPTVSYLDLDKIGHLEVLTRRSLTRRD